MKKKNLKSLNLNKKSISNLAIYGGAPPPRDTEDSVCSVCTAPSEHENMETELSSCILSKKIYKTCSQ
ncbi:MAG: hypothetical protein AAF611_12540 [Bacteroidota bacterium]